MTDPNAEAVEKDRMERTVGWERGLDREERPASARDETFVAAPDPQPEREARSVDELMRLVREGVLGRND